MLSDLVTLLTIYISTQVPNKVQDFCACVTNILMVKVVYCKKHMSRDFRGGRHGVAFCL